MTDLSPAAQAVLDAFKEQVELTWLTKDPEQVGLAAALRAVADQAEIFFDAYDEPRRVVTVDDLLNIAAELEGAR